MAIFVWWKNTDFVEEKSPLFWGVVALPDQQRTQSIQEMDLHHIPSTRRNQVISDVFLQLNFMERRGSGIDRILNSYAEVAQRPVFYSDSDIFLVTPSNWLEVIESPKYGVYQFVKIKIGLNLFD